MRLAVSGRGLSAQDSISVIDATSACPPMAGASASAVTQNTFFSYSAVEATEHEIAGRAALDPREDMTVDADAVFTVSVREVGKYAVCYYQAASALGGRRLLQRESTPSSAW